MFAPPNQNDKHQDSLFLLSSLSGNSFDHLPLVVSNPTHEGPTLLVPCIGWFYRPLHAFGGSSRSCYSLRANMSGTEYRRLSVNVDILSKLEPIAHIG